MHLFSGKQPHIL